MANTKDSIRRRALLKGAAGAAGAAVAVQAPSISNLGLAPGYAATASANADCDACVTEIGMTPAGATIYDFSVSTTAADGSVASFLVPFAGGGGGFGYNVALTTDAFGNITGSATLDDGGDPIGVTVNIFGANGGVCATCVIDFCV